MRCHAALALAAVLGLWAGPALAASLAVVTEGDRVFRYELVLEPGEVVAGIQLDLLAEGASVVVLGTGFSITLGALGPFVFNPWTLTSRVAPVSEVVRVAHTYDQQDHPGAGWSDLHEILPSGFKQTYAEFIIGNMGFLCDFGVCVEDFRPLGIPVARLLIEDGPAPTLYTAGICVPAAGATCSFPQTNVPEPVVPVLLAPLGLLLVTRRNTAEQD